ncbi:hypothetical protein CR513_29576, partial [Mucuna pruriens]
MIHDDYHNTETLVTLEKLSINFNRNVIKFFIRKNFSGIKSLGSNRFRDKITKNFMLKQLLEGKEIN